MGTIWDLRKVHEVILDNARFVDGRHGGWATTVGARPGPRLRSQPYQSKLLVPVATCRAFDPSARMIHTW